MPRIRTTCADAETLSRSESAAALLDEQDAESRILDIGCLQPPRCYNAAPALGAAEPARDRNAPAMVGKSITDRSAAPVSLAATSGSIAFARTPISVVITIIASDRTAEERANAKRCAVAKSLP
jgi:hypothetical protein